MSTARLKKKSDELKKKSAKHDHKHKADSKPPKSENIPKKYVTKSSLEDKSSNAINMKNTSSAVSTSPDNSDSIYLQTVWGVDKLIREFDEQFSVSNLERIKQDNFALDEKLNKAFNNKFDSAFSFTEKCLPAPGLPSEHKDILKRFHDEAAKCITVSVINTKTTILISEARILQNFREQAANLKQDLTKLVSHDPSDLILQDKMKLITMNIDCMNTVSACYKVWMEKSLKIAEFLGNLSKCLAKPTKQPSIATLGSAGQFAASAISTTRTMPLGKQPTSTPVPQSKK